MFVLNFSFKSNVAMRFYIILVSFFIIVLFTSFHTKEKITNSQSNLELKKQHINKMLKINDIKNSKISVADIQIKEYKIDSIFRNLSYSNKFNGCVLVAQHGKVIYKNSFGYANPILQEQLQTNSVFQLASVSKTITAISILMLVEKNLLGLDDYVSVYFPDFPYTDVTIRHLLNHRSGLPDYIKLSHIYYPQSVMYYTNQDAYNALVSANAPREFPANARFRYNNSNYMLLGLIVEKITGISFPEFVKLNIFEPLKMTNSFFAFPDQIWAMENRTFGLYHNNQIYPNDRFDGVFGDKGAYSTVEDMYKFDRGLYPNILLKKHTLNMAFTNYVLEPSNKKYGLGFRLREDQNKQTIIYHNGWWHGYRTAFHRRESDNSCVIILSNRLDKTVYSKAKEMFNILDNYYEYQDAEANDE